MGTASVPGSPPRAREVLDNVERVHAPDAETFDRRYLRTGTPVVLTDLFAADHLDHLADPVVARAELGDMPVPITSEERAVPFADVMEILEGTDPSRPMGFELNMPDVLGRGFPFRPYLSLGDPHDAWVEDVFLGNRGSATHLHYDVDLRDVVVYQVFGRKRYVIIDPGETRKLGPSESWPAGNFSATFLERFSTADLQAFLRYTSAWDCVLEPGEALLIPAMAWHYVEYLDTALSAHFRLARNRYRAVLEDADLPPGPALLALAACFRDEDQVDAGLEEIFRTLLTAARRRYLTARARTQALEEMCDALCALLGLAVSRPYQDPAVERRDPKLAGMAAFTTT